MQTNPATKELKTLMQKHCINQPQLGIRISIPQNRICEILNNRRRFSPETDIKLCKVFALKSGHFLRLQQEFETSQAQEKYKQQLSKIIPL